MSNCEDVRLFCNGYYPEIMIMDPFSLEVVLVLSSKVNPDWISALHVLHPAKCKNDVVLALTTTGMFKVWTLLGHENKHSEPIYENESKHTRCLNAICLQCCAYNQRTVLIVCSKYWQIYDAGMQILYLWLWMMLLLLCKIFRWFQRPVFLRCTAWGALDVWRFPRRRPHFSVVRCGHRIHVQVAHQVSH